MPGASLHPASPLHTTVEIVVGTVTGAHFRADVTGIATRGRSLSLDRVHALNIFHLRENAVSPVRGRLEQKPGYGIGLRCIGLGDLLSTNGASIIRCPIRSLAVGTNLVILGVGIEEVGGGRFQRPSWPSIGGRAAGDQGLPLCQESVRLHRSRPAQGEVHDGRQGGLLALRVHSSFLSPFVDPFSPWPRLKVLTITALAK
jgi:hypothetical protein